MIMEAVAVKVSREEAKAQQRAKAQEFKKDPDGLARLKAVGGG